MPYAKVGHSALLVGSIKNLPMLIKSTQDAEATKKISKKLEHKRRNLPSRKT